MRLSRQTWVALFAVIMVAGGVALIAYVRSPHYARHAVSVDAYRVAKANELTVFVTTGAWDIVEPPIVREGDDAVVIEVTVSEYVPPLGGFKNLASYEHQVTIRLGVPLGDRQVIDATTGTPIRQATE